MRWPVPSDWPNAMHAHRIYCAPHRWHVQRTGQGPQVLLIHGAGGSTHSMAGLFAALCETHEVIAIDLPGHGFTQLGARHRSGLEQMAEDLAKLCQQEAIAPQMIVGHSAGCAVALQMALRHLSPRGQLPQVIGINAALSQFSGLAGAVFPALAKGLASLPFTARVFSNLAGNAERVQSLIRGTGSELNAEQLSQYTRLVSDRDHVDGALLMMSQWDLTPLLNALPEIQNPCLLIAGDKDQTVPPAVSEKAVQRLSTARYVLLDGLGHLAHEESPNRILETLSAWRFQSDN